MKPPVNSPRNSPEWQAYRNWFAEQPDDGWRDLALSTHGVRSLEALVAKLAAPADVFAGVGARWVEGVGLPVIPETRDEIVIRVKLEEHDRKVEALCKTLAGQPGGYRGLRDAFRDVTGSNVLPIDNFVGAMVGRDGYDSGWSTADRMRESVTTSSWPSLLGDATHRHIVAQYRTSPGTNAWSAIVSSQSFNCDFRLQRMERLGGYGQLPIVNEGAPFNALPTPSNDAEATYRVAKRGGSEDLSLEAYANDDIGAFKTSINSMARAAAVTLNKNTLDIFVNNAAIFDGSLLFAAAHSNVASSPLSATALEVAMLKLRKQTRLGDSTEVLGLAGRFLLVAPELQVLATQLASAYNSPALSTRSDLQEPLDVIVGAHWTSASAWFVVADPNATPTIECGFSNSTSDPEITIQGPDDVHGAAFTADKVTIRIRHPWGLGVADYRGLVRGNS